MSGTNLMLFSRAGSGRIGVTVSRKVGIAVVRNRVKRWIRECFRRQRDVFPRHVDMVVVARPAAAGAGHAAVCRELSALAKRLGGS
jgi:ribonuclease P protein component